MEEEEEEGVGGGGGERDRLSRSQPARLVRDVEEDEEEEEEEGLLLLLLLLLAASSGGEDMGGRGGGGEECRCRSTQVVAIVCRCFCESEKWRDGRITCSGEAVHKGGMRAVNG